MSVVVVKGRGLSLKGSTLLKLPVERNLEIHSFGLDCTRENSDHGEHGHTSKELFTGRVG